MDWLVTGKLVHQEHLVAGLENAASSLSLLFTGGNKGKLIVEIAQPSLSSGGAPVSKL